MGRKSNRRLWDVYLPVAGVCAYALFVIFDKPPKADLDLPDFAIEDAGPFDPTESYHSLTVAGWQFYISRDLYVDIDSYRIQLKNLQKHIEYADALIPQHVKDTIGPVTIWVEHKPNSKYAGRFVHHEARDFKANPDKKGNIELNLSWGIDRDRRALPSVFIHEIAHAYHSRLSDRDNLRITRLYAKARDSGKYLEADIDDAFVSTRYAMTNQWEYFAELSALLILAEDGGQKTLGKIREVDPKGVVFVEELWLNL